MDTALIRTVTKRNRRRVPRSAIAVIGAIAISIGLLVLLQIAGSLSLGGRGTLPTTTEVIVGFISILPKEQTLVALAGTISSWLIGFAISLVGGVALGLLVGSFDWLYRSTKILFDFLRATPAVALIPMVVLILSTGTTFKIVLIVFACIWVILVQTTAGLRSIDPQSRDAARSMRMSTWQEARWVLLPGTLPFVITGMRIAAVKALLICIGLEVLAGAPGIGNEIVQAQNDGAIAQMWAYVLFASLLGISTGYLFALFERGFLRWHASQRVAVDG